MAIGFPPSPSIGTSHTYNGTEWEWTGSGWKKVLAGGVVTRSPYLEPIPAPFFYSAFNFYGVDAVPGVFIYNTLAEISYV